MSEFTFILLKFQDFSFVWSGSLKGTKRQASGQMSQNVQTVKTIEIQSVTGQLRYVVKYKVRKMAKSLSKDHCCCPMLLMQTTKTSVCLRTKAIFHHLYGF